MPGGFNLASRSLLTPRDLGRFEGDTLFCAIARAVCAADCLPRKELYESWEVARRVRRRLRGGRVLDLACGHGLIAQLLLILDDTSPRALAIDARIPESAAKLSAVLRAKWPRLEGRVEFQQLPLEQVRVEENDLVVSAHACGALTDKVLSLAADASARVAVLPCCHDGDASDAAGLAGWVAEDLAIDAARAIRLRDRGYRIHTQTIPREITPKNRLLIGQPLLEVYRSARYRAHLPEGSIELRDGEPAPALDALTNEWALITAWNPGSRKLARAENERRQAALRHELGAYRLHYAQGEGDGWSAELGVLALGIPLDDALARARAWGQFAILAGRRGEPARVVLVPG